MNEEPETQEETLQSKWLEFYIAIAYPTLGGMIGAITQIAAKTVSVFIASSTSELNYFTTPWPYFAIALVLCCGGTQIHFLNLGLRSHDQLIVVPTFMVSLEVFSVVSGLIFWGEFNSFTPLRAFLFILGILTSFAGIYITTRGRRQRRENELLSSHATVR